MRFWDSSAIVPLVLDEGASQEARGLLRDDRGMVVWWGTPVEVLSALERAEREGEVPPADVDLARRALDDLSGRWNEVLPSDEVRERAGVGLLHHPLRVGDALQLGAALTWARGRPRGRGFVSLDDRLADAARREGFEILMSPEA